MAFEAVRLATKYMTPVVLLSDSFLANSAEPFRIPDVATLPDLRVPVEATPGDFAPYRRDPGTLARPWLAPGAAGFEHRIGGLEKQDVTGIVSYDGANHRKMTLLRAQKVAGIAADIPEAQVDGPEAGDVLAVSWGSSYGAVTAAVGELQRAGRAVAHLSLRYINPLPRNVGDVLKRFRHLLVVEANLGQLSLILRNQFPFPWHTLNKVEGRPFLIREVRAAIEELLNHA
jgi:2-oxoglutarate ferredoxin oxidoreductase subunit alpha